MTKDQYAKMELLVDKALSLPPEERDPFIQQECGSDEELLQEITSLLQFEDQAFDFVQNLSENVVQPSLANLYEDKIDSHHIINSFIKHYHIIEKLGSGGMGVVYKAQDTRLDRTVALKFLPPFRMHNEQNKKRLLREARAAAALNHPNIATVYEIEESDDRLFIVMGFYEGITLLDKIKEGNIDIREVIQIALNIASGLQKAHRKNIIHRDIKPANIIFSEDDQLKIIDFGLAKLNDQSMLTKTGTTLGTVSYMSPEQIQGAAVDHRTDIWALGVLLYEMLTGKCPFQGEYEQAVMCSITNEEPEYLSKVNPDVPVRVEKIINKALQKKPGKRFESMNDMHAALKEALDEIDSGKSRLAPVFKLGRKQRRMAYQISAVFLVLAILAVFFWYSPGADSHPVSIALLPLENLSSNETQEWLSDGMTDALITDLARISGLRIISRSSVMRYKGTDKIASEIAAELGVDYLIEGSVLEMDDQVKITTRLIDATNNEYLWAQQYNRDLKNIMQLQGEVAEAIAGQIEVQLIPYEHLLLSERKEVDPEAYKAYLRGNYHWFQLTKQSLETAENYYQLAIEIDPDYALAYGGVALSYLARAQMGYEPFQDISGPAEIAAQKALEIDSTLAEVHYMLAVLNTWMYWNWNKADSEFKKAIELNPNFPEARAYYSHLLFFLKRPEEALDQIQDALKLDPFNPLFQSLYSMDLLYLERYDDVISMMEKNLEISPGDRVSLSTLRSAYHQNGMFEEAIEAWRKTFEVNRDEEAIETLMNGYAIGGYENALKKVAELYIERSKTEYVTPWQIGTLYTRAGMQSEALKYLEKAYEDHDLNMPYLSVDPIFDYMRDDPGFIELMEKMKL